MPAKECVPPWFPSSCIYPFALPIKVDKVEGAVLVDQLKSLDWAGRQAQFHSKAEPALLTKVRQYISVLLGIR